MKDVLHEQSPVPSARDATTQLIFLYIFLALRGQCSKAYHAGVKRSRHDPSTIIETDKGLRQFWAFQFISRVVNQSQMDSVLVEAVAGSSDQVYRGISPVKTEHSSQCSPFMHRNHRRADRCRQIPHRHVLKQT